MATYEPNHEVLKSRETTPEGRHLHEPDAFPHAMMGRLVLLTVVFAVAIGALWAVGGTRGALIGGAILLVVVFPLVASRTNRRAQKERVKEIEEEHQVEAQEHAGEIAVAQAHGDEGDKRAYPSHQW
jgi:hypothetical protein